MACVTIPAATAEMELAFSLLPGFRFHPTDQELVNFFLKRKVLGHGGYFIPEVDLYNYKLEPDELPGKSFSPSTSDPRAKVEWYLFAPRERKYPTGLRMERATLKGFWKSTGKDRPIMHNGIVVGMKKTLVFHISRAPSGTRTDWVIHEYRLHDHHIQDTYALCRVIKKNMVSPLTNVSSDADTDEDLMQFMPGGIDIDKYLMEYVSDGANSDKDPKHFVLGGVESDKETMEHASCSTGSYKDPKQFMLGDVDSDKDMVQFAFGGVGTEKNPIQIECEVDCVDMDKGEKQFLTDGDDTGKGDVHILNGGANKDKDGMQPATGGATADEDNSDNTADEDNSDNSWYTRYLAEEDTSWMQFPTVDGWYTSDDMGMIP